MRTFTFIKNTTGSLRITLDSYDMLQKTQDFVFGYNVERITVPYNYALGLFVSPDALSQYRLGYFLIDDYAALEKAGREQGLVYGEDEDVKHYSKEELNTKILKDHNAKFAQEVLDSGDLNAISMLVLMVKDNIESLPGALVSVVEKKCGVELRIE